MCDFDDFFDDFGWEEMGMAGALAEEMAEEEKERLRLERELEKEQERIDEELADCDIYNPSDDEEFLP